MEQNFGHPSGTHYLDDLKRDFEARESTIMSNNLYMAMFIDKDPARVQFLRRFVLNFDGTRVRQNLGRRANAQPANEGGNKVAGRWFGHDFIGTRLE